MTNSLAEHYGVRTWLSWREEIVTSEGIRVDRPLIKAAVGVIIANPFAGKPFQTDLSSLTIPSHLLGQELGRRAVSLLGGLPIESYGKGGIAGLGGSQEHVVACITTVFGDALREAVGGGKAWISSTTKVAAAGASIDIPLAFKDELYVRSHYDTVTLTSHGGPKEDELLICVGVASGGRPHHRVGGMSREEALQRLVS